MLMRFVSTFAALATTMVAETRNSLSPCDAVYNECRCSATCRPSSLLKRFVIQ
jgi:hypothetical protein